MKDMRYINYAINGTQKKLSDLFVLIKSNPELPIIPCVDSEIIADSGYNWWLGSWGNAHIETFLSTQEYGMLYKDDIVDVFGKFFDYEECEITNDMPDDEVEKIMREYVDKLPWQTAILVNIDLPNVPILKSNEYGRLERDSQ